jgi:hypothetical protein
MLKKCLTGPTLLEMRFINNECGRLVCYWNLRRIAPSIHDPTTSTTIPAAS